MRTSKISRIRATSVLAAFACMCAGFAGATRAAEPNCTQTRVDGSSPPATSYYIYPRQRVQPFYQWESNNGYCGETSLIEAGLSNGQYMSQFNARLICGTGLSQAGTPGACFAHALTPDYNAQLLIEDPGTGVTGPNTYADAALCMANSRLNGTTFPYTTQRTGTAGYRQYMSWIKQKVINGEQVTIAVLVNGGSDPQYDHIVAVVAIGTNNAPTDATYYRDDVLYFDDHGAYTLRGIHSALNPGIPPGAGTDDTGCTPYVYGYTFASLAQTRSGANSGHPTNSAVHWRGRGNRIDVGANRPNNSIPTGQAYSIVLPGKQTISTSTGGSGYDTVPIIGPHNYAFSVSGPLDSKSETLLVALKISGPTFTKGVANPADPIAGFCYENPLIAMGSGSWTPIANRGAACTDQPPETWMTNVTLDATVSGLKKGRSYNLYEYAFSAITGTGAAAALKVPVSDFNANAALATKVTHFTATGPTYTLSVTTTSNMIVVFRAVPASGP